MTYTIAFVDGISASPSTRLDLHSASTWTVTADSVLSPPRLDYAYSGSLLADGRPLTSAAYGNRVIRLVLQLKHNTSDDVAAGHIQDLARELNRTSNILKWQPGTTAPVFFRTLRADYSAIYWDAVQRRVTVEIPAEPFAYGLKESPTPITVTDDPAAGSNGCFFDLTSIKGDVETPLIMRFPDTSLSTLAATSVFGIRRRGTVSALPLFRQMEALTSGTDTANQVDATASGGNSKRCTFTTFPAMATRVSGTLTSASASVDLRGTYRVFLRAKKSSAADVMTLQLAWGYGALSVANSPVNATVLHTAWQYYDLGLMQLPTGADPITDGYSNTELPVAPITVYAQAARASGAGTLDFDVMVFVPADDTLFLATWPGDTGDLEQFVIDGPREVVYGTKTSAPPTQIVTTSAIALAGGFVKVSPGNDNRIVMLPTTGASDDKTFTIAVTPEYWPRYLFVRPVAS